MIIFSVRRRNPRVLFRKNQPKLREWHVVHFRLVVIKHIVKSHREIGVNFCRDREASGVKFENFSVKNHNEVKLRFCTLWFKKMCTWNRFMHSFIILSKTCILWCHQSLVIQCNWSKRAVFWNIEIFWQGLVYIRVLKMCFNIGLKNEKQRSQKSCFT